MKDAHQLAQAQMPVPTVPHGAAGSQREAAVELSHSVPLRTRKSQRAASVQRESSKSLPLTNSGIQSFSPSDIIIAVMGITGSGKSSFISILVGRDVGIGHGLESCTSDVSIYSFMYNESQAVHLIDTPGFDDTNRSDADVLKAVAFYFSETYKMERQLAGVIYLHRITDPRLAGSGLKNLTMFKKLCGEGKDVYQHIVLATTMWGNLQGPGLSRATGKDRQQELINRKDWWGIMYNRGSKVYEYEDSKASAMRIIEHLVGLKSKAVLDIQKEMVDNKTSLENTAAGLEVERDLQELRQRHQKDLIQLEVERQEALAEKDQELLEELAKSKDETNKKLLAAQRASEELKIDFERFERDQQAKIRQVIEEADKRSVRQERNHDESLRQLKASHQASERRMETHWEQKRAEQEGNYQRVQKNLERLERQREADRQQYDDNKRETDRQAAIEKRVIREQASEKDKQRTREHRDALSRMEQRGEDDRQAFEERERIRERDQRTLQGQVTALQRQPQSVDSGDLRSRRPLSSDEESSEEVFKGDLMPIYAPRVLR